MAAAKKKGAAANQKTAAKAALVHICPVCRINLLIFIKILKVILSKLRANNQNGYPDYKLRLTQATLTLIPLFGIHVFFIFATDEQITGILLHIKVFLTLFLKSFKLLRVDVSILDVESTSLDSALKVCFSPAFNGHLLVTTSANKILWISANTGWLLREVSKVHKHQCSSLAVRDDGRFLLTAGRNAVKVWDYSMKLVVNSQMFIGHSQPIRQVSFSPDQMGVVSVGDAIYFLDFLAHPQETGTERRGALVLLEQEMMLDGTVVSATFDDVMDIGIVGTTAGTRWYINWVDNTSIRLISGNKSKVNYVVFSPDVSHFATCGEDGSVKVWSAPSNELVVQFQVLKQVMFSAELDGLLAVSSPVTGLTIRIISDHRVAPITTIQCVKKRESDSLPPSLAAFNPIHPDLVAYGVERELSFYSLAKKQAIKKIALSHWAMCMSLSSEVRLIAGGSKGKLLFTVAYNEILLCEVQGL
ncbi:hypothetical protein J4Q44_G00281460 [Coregonus suidteri]|uniref:Uncharacterized protein n=1 Tax=Coregonus suidteri TaxID=861788 RepID=A0AAN8L211_9TELE